jgi:hypothetical protein
MYQMHHVSVVIAKMSLIPSNTCSDVAHPWASGHVPTPSAGFFFEKSIHLSPEVYSSAERSARRAFENAREGRPCEKECMVKLWEVLVDPSPLWDLGSG